MPQTNAAEQLRLINHEAELAVLSAMLNDTSQAIDLAQDLGAEDFYDPRRKVLFQAIVNILLGIEPLSRGNILAECKKVAQEFDKKHPPYVTDEFLNSLPPLGEDANRYAITVHRLSWLRSAGDYAYWLASELQKNPDPDQLYVEAQSRWQVLAPAKKDGATLYGWDTIPYSQDLARQRKDEAEQGLTRRFDWPWKSWNERIRPGIAGWVGLIAAPDGMGKSLYLECIAEHWAKRGNKTVLIHLEDNREYKLNRRKARYSKVSLSAIEDGLITPEEDRLIAEAERAISPWVANLHYTQAVGWTMSQCLSELDKLIDEGECECVVMDYIDNCVADRNQIRLYGNQHYLREGDNMHRLKNWADQRGVPVFTATQGNKSMQDQGRIKTRQDIDGSGKKSQRTQLAIIMTRDIVGEDGLWSNGEQIAEEGDYSPIVNLRVDKQNRGKTQTFRQVMRGEVFRIGDIARDRTPIEQEAH